uniref:Uncharacterized protein n=1 Tax=Gadus morhua TaxID=8049 RepID=A0A8C5AL63_GADMO
MSGSRSSRGAALFSIPTSSSNSEANTEEGRLIPDTSITAFNINLLVCDLVKRSPTVFSGTNILLLRVFL